MKGNRPLTQYVEVSQLLKMSNTYRHLIIPLAKLLSTFALQSLARESQEAIASIIANLVALQIGPETI